MRAPSRRPICSARSASLRGRWQSSSRPAASIANVRRSSTSASPPAFRASRARWPAALSGTDLDPDANRKRMEAIVKRMEDLGDVAGRSGGRRRTRRCRRRRRLAAMLKEALAANTIGGKADEDSRMRAAAEEMRQAQQNLSRIGVMPDHERRALTGSVLQRAIRRISERAAQAGRARGAGWAGAGRR